MAKIKLTDTGFQMIAEGTHIFKIVEATYDEDFGKMVITMQTKNGQKHTERFGLMTADGEVNEKAIKAFSYFAKTALNNFNVEEIDEQDLIGCYIKAEVKHVESSTLNPKTGEPYVNVQLGDKFTADGFEGGNKIADAVEKAVEEWQDVDGDETEDDLDFLND